MFISLRVITCLSMRSRDRRCLDSRTTIPLLKALCSQSAYPPFAIRTTHQNIMQKRNFSRFNSQILDKSDDQPSNKRARISNLFSPIKVATKEAAAAADVDPPFKKLLRALDNDVTEGPGSRSVVYWMRMADLRSESEVSLWHDLKHWRNQSSRQQSLVTSVWKGRATKCSSYRAILDCSAGLHSTWPFSKKDWFYSSKPSCFEGMFRTYAHPNTFWQDETRKSYKNYTFPLSSTPARLEQTYLRSSSNSARNMAQMLCSRTTNTKWMNSGGTSRSSTLSYPKQCVSHSTTTNALWILKLWRRSKINHTQWDIYLLYFLRITINASHQVFSPYHKNWIATFNQNTSRFVEESPLPKPNFEDIRNSELFSSLFTVEIPQSIAGFELDEEHSRRMKDVWPEGETVALKASAHFCMLSTKGNQLIVCRCSNISWQQRHMSVDWELCMLLIITRRKQTNIAESWSITPRGIAPIEIPPVV